MVAPALTLTRPAFALAAVPGRTGRISGASPAKPVRLTGTSAALNGLTINLLASSQEQETSHEL